MLQPYSLQKHGMNESDPDWEQKLWLNLFSSFPFLQKTAIMVAHDSTVTFPITVLISGRIRCRIIMPDSFEPVSAVARGFEHLRHCHFLCFGHVTFL